jgi:hypothetical protein
VLIATAAFVFHITEMPPAKPASTVSWQGGFFRYREIYPDGLRRWWLGNAGWREPTSSDRLPSIGVSLQPAIPRRVAPQQSPLPLHQSPTIVPQIPVRRGNQIARLNLTAGIQSRSPSSCPSPRGCHLYIARRVTFLSCADNERRRRETADGPTTAARCDRQQRQELPHSGRSPAPQGSAQEGGRAPHAPQRAVLPLPRGTVEVSS